MELSQAMLKRIDEIVQLLKCVPPGEVEIGWDDARAQGWMSYLEKLQTAISGGGLLAAEYENATLLRWLDSQSICGGRIADMIVEVEGDLRKLVAQEKHGNKGSEETNEEVTTGEAMINPLIAINDIIEIIDRGR